MFLSKIKSTTSLKNVFSITFLLAIWSFEISLFNEIKLATLKSMIYNRYIIYNKRQSFYFQIVYFCKKSVIKGILS